VQVQCLDKEAADRAKLVLVTTGYIYSEQRPSISSPEIVLVTRVLDQETIDKLQAIPNVTVTATSY
jgi:hypothetical protein